MAPPARMPEGTSIFKKPGIIAATPAAASARIMLNVRCCVTVGLGMAIDTKSITLTNAIPNNDAATRCVDLLKVTPLSLSHRAEHVVDQTVIIRLLGIS